MADDLTDAEREMIKKHREEAAAERAKLDDADEVSISWGDKSFTGPFRRAREVARSWGFDLEPPAQPANPDDDKSKPTRFAGRRVG